MLRTFYKEKIINLDASLMQLVENKVENEKWGEFHEMIQTIGEQANDVLNLLAEELRLSKVK